MKNIKLILFCIILTLVFSGCGQNPSNNPPENETTQNENGAISETKIINSEKISDDIAGFTEITSYVGDCDGDGNDETIVLSTAAERDEKGNFLWNDGQNWALYVTDNFNDAYMLYDGYVQAGNVYFDVADYYMSDVAKPVITVTVSTGAGLNIKNYTFSNDNNGYKETVIYDTQSIAEGGINKRFSSVPELLK